MQVYIYASMEVCKVCKYASLHACKCEMQGCKCMKIFKKVFKYASMKSMQVCKYTLIKVMPVKPWQCQI